MKSKFVTLINKREVLIRKTFGEDVIELLNLPGARAQYCKDILPLDKQILASANLLLRKFGVAEKVTEINQVFENKVLMKYYSQQNKKQSEKKDREK